MFISQEYVQKMWPSHERKNALAREVRQIGGYVLPVRFDKTPLPDLPDTIGYLDATKLTPEQVAEIEVVS